MYHNDDFFLFPVQKVELNINILIKYILYYVITLNISTLNIIKIMMVEFLLHDDSLSHTVMMSVMSCMCHLCQPDVIKLRARS